MKAAIYDRKNLTDLLLTSVENFPAKGVGYVQSDGSVKFITYSEILTKAGSMSAMLHDSGMEPGNKVMIISSKNEDIVLLLWASLLGGLIPTILQPPVSFTEFNQPAQKILNVFRILKNPKMILSDDLLHVFQSESIPAENIISAEKLKAADQGKYIYEANESDTAYVQFSSGSTGDPKGIVLTHKNILTNLAAISVGLDIYDNDVFTNWMPLYHDMGLFGYHLCPLFANNNQYLIDPVDFVKRPAIWPDTMDAIKCTITGCPNFGQALLLRYLKNRDEKTWDLSVLKAIVNGAEPISNRIMSEFMNRLASSGLRKGAMMPAYGMAEATLAISFSALLKEPVVHSFNRTKLQLENKAVLETESVEEMMELVSVGFALDNNEIRVVDDQGDIMDDQKVGNIQIRGAGITGGYYDKPEETRNSFIDRWLKTGDRGFFFEQQLYITGRVKDIIFVHGQNLYAHDLENLAAKHADIPYGKVIVGGWFDTKKGHDLIILFLVGSANKATCNTFVALRNFFRDTYGISIDIFIPIRSNQVPKTSSGKIQRYKLIDDFQNGLFDEAVTAIKKLIKEQQ